MRDPVSLGEILAGSGEEAGPVARARALHRLGLALRAQLPEPMRDHFAIGQVRDGILTIHADSSAWASRLHYYAGTLLNYLHRHHGLRLKSVQVRVTPVAGTRAPRSRQPLSPRGAESVRRGAETVSDPHLRAALLRLARRSG